MIFLCNNVFCFFRLKDLLSFYLNVLLCEAFHSESRSQMLHFSPDGFRNLFVFRVCGGKIYLRVHLFLIHKVVLCCCLCKSTGDTVQEVGNCFCQIDLTETAEQKAADKTKQIQQIKPNEG